MVAIAEDGDIRQVLEKRCIGCGLCLSRCPVGAISLRALPDRREGPPPIREEILDILAAERGIGRAPVA